MPVTARLLQRLQKTLGDEATDDLVTWIEREGDRTFGQLRQLADAYFARFDARLEQRLAELRAELRSESAKGFAEMRAEFTKGFAEMRSEYTRESAQGFAALRVEIAAQRGDLIKWMFVFWVGTIVPLAGLMVVLLKFWKP